MSGADNSSATARPEWLSWRDDAQELAQRTVVVLSGGTSTEREVSLASGRAVVGALRAPDGPTGELRPDVQEVEISADGTWQVNGRALSPPAALEALPSDALFLLALHGGTGEDGRIQAFLEISGRTFTGTSHDSAALCMHKGRTRLVAEAAGLRVAPGLVFTAPEWTAERERLLEQARALPGDVRFVKHATGGSSLLLFRCTNATEVEAACDEIARVGGDLVVEAGAVGLEVSCGVVGDGGAARALPVVEILPRSAAGFFDYDEKYSEDGALERCPAECLAPEGERAVQAAAVRTWQAVGGEGYARIDFIVPWREEGIAAGEPILLEVNTLPGFTPRSLLPREASAAGVGYRELCFEILARGLRRRPTPV